MEKTEFAANSLLEAIPRVMDRIRTEMRAQASECLTIPQFRVLNKLRVNDSFTNKELADSMGLTPATLTRMIDLLSGRGLVERLHSAEDRRQIFFNVTIQGKRKIRNYNLKLAKKINQQLQQLSTEEIDALISGISILKKYF